MKKRENLSDKERYFYNSARLARALNIITENEYQQLMLVFIQKPEKEFIKQAKCLLDNKVFWVQQTADCLLDLKM
jgi:hypothetical protein